MLCYKLFGTIFSLDFVSFEFLLLFGLSAINNGWYLLSLLIFVYILWVSWFSTFDKFSVFCSYSLSSQSLTFILSFDTFDIKIDASDSIDESMIRIGQFDDPLLLFSWICPENIESFCKKYIDPDRKNSKFTGKWLVSTITHRFTGVKLHKMELTLIRDSIPKSKTEG